MNDVQRLWLEMKIVLAEEVRRQLRRKQYLIITFAPVVILLVLAVAVPLARGFFSGDGASGERANGERIIAIVNRSTDLTFATQISDEVQVFADRQAGVTALQAGDVDDLFIIPADFLQTGRVEWLHTDSGLSSIIAGDDSEDRMRAILLQALTSADLSADRIARLQDPLNLMRFEVTREGDVAAKKRGNSSRSLRCRSYRRGS